MEKYLEIYEKSLTNQEEGSRLIVGLFGPSCSGKSSFLRALQEKLDFYIPIGITTRPKRAEENGDLEHINDLEFIERAQKDSLCFIAKVSGYYYAYPIINPSIRNIAIEIRRENIPELKTYNGVVIKVIPCRLEEGIGRILSKRKQGTYNGRGCQDTEIDKFR